MPRFDGTGPNGQGSMTGRRMGRCVNNVNETNAGDNGDTATAGGEFVRGGFCNGSRKRIRGGNGRAGANSFGRGFGGRGGANRRSF